MLIGTKVNGDPTEYSFYAGYAQKVSKNREEITFGRIFMGKCCINGNFAVTLPLLLSII